MADIAAFYSAFGLELTPEVADRVDHIAMECEFFAVLCAKEARAAETADADHLRICQAAQKEASICSCGLTGKAPLHRPPRLSGQAQLSGVTRGLGEFL